MHKIRLLTGCRSFCGFGAFQAEEQASPLFYNLFDSSHPCLLMLLHHLPPKFRTCNHIFLFTHAFVRRAISGLHSHSVLLSNSLAAICLFTISSFVVKLQPF